MTTIYLVRHAQAARQFPGDSSPENPAVLTTVGKQQVITLTEKLHDVPFTHIYSSPLMRAKQTANYLANYFHIPLTIDQDLEEMRIPHTDDEVVQRIQEISSIRRTDEEKFTLKYFDDAESQYDMAQRIQHALISHAKDHINENILAVSHGQIMCSLAILLGFGTVSEIQQSGLENTGYFILQVALNKLVLKEIHGLKKKSL